jgi:hypothetical protein
MKTPKQQVTTSSAASRRVITPIASINPDRYIQHNLAVADSGRFGAVMKQLPGDGARETYSTLSGWRVRGGPYGLTSLAQDRL